MAKKNWISVKRGLSEDPKHRANMGECIWLFLHIIDRADWETGIVYGWKDEDEASEMCMPLPTMRHQRRKLEQAGYITCEQHFQGQDITIHEWINPRDYSGGVKNKKQKIDGDNYGDNPLSPYGYNHGDNDGDNHVDSQVITPTSDSPSVSPSNKRGDLINGLQDLYNMPGAKIAVLKEHIESRVKVRLNLNTSGRDAKTFVDMAANARKKDGQDIDKFIDWWLKDSPDAKYWSFSRMTERWNMAFSAPVKSKELALVY